MHLLTQWVQDQDTENVSSISRNEYYTVMTFYSMQYYYGNSTERPLSIMIKGKHQYSKHESDSWLS